ncbi:hypothetical protein FB451DRAFT_202046 [Mycena latifolia]|nr:hypothetical protein FB451DRAFT_202046 [Mycena latifolia]
MLSLNALPPDILLQIVPFLTLPDVVSLSIVSKALQALSKEHSFWLDPLRTTRLSLPLACPSGDDLALYTTDGLKQLALHSIRLARNWRKPVPQIAGPVRTFQCGVHNSIVFNLSGTHAILLHSLVHGTMVCCDTSTGLSSAPVYVGRIIDMSSPLEQRGTWTVAALVNDDELIVLTVTLHPVASVDIIFRRGLEPGHINSAVFMTDAVVGVARVQSAGMEVQSFNILQPDISTTIITDRPRADILGSTVIDDTVYFISLQFTQAFVYACPRRLLAYAPPSPDIDYSIRRSHVARIPRPLSDPDRLDRPLSFMDYCVLPTEPARGRNTISVVKTFTTSANPQTLLPHSLEITFWPRPEAGAALRPAQTVSVPGSLSTQSGTAWELLIIANSGLAVAFVVDPEPRPVSELLDPNPQPPPLPPKLMMAKVDPLGGAVSLHELQLPEPELAPKTICELALDDHLGYVIVVTTDNVLHCVPYA